MHGCVNGGILSLDDDIAAADERECCERCRPEIKAALPWDVDKERRIGVGVAAARH